MPDPLIAIVMGSANDRPRMEGAAEILRSFSIPFEWRILSAHRTPEASTEYFASLEDRGVKVVICGAGGAAHLAGVAAAHTILPVIGVPLDASPIRGLDSLLSTVQMPPGIPVATMAIGEWGARNAALYAAAILALKDEALRNEIKSYRRGMAEKILSMGDLA